MAFDYGNFNYHYPHLFNHDGPIIYMIAYKEEWGKIYIGKSVSPSDSRIRDHIRDSRNSKAANSYLYNAMRKHGLDCFETCVIEKFPIGTPNSVLNERERYWIKKYESHISQGGYNMTWGGDGGNTYAPGRRRAKYKKIQDTSRMGSKPGHVHPESAIKKISGSNNYQCKYVYHTPWGSFGCLKDLVQAAKDLRAEGCKLVITDHDTIRKYCHEDVILNPNGKRTPEEWRGKSTKSLGFYVEAKQ